MLGIEAYEAYEARTPKKKPPKKRLGIHSASVYPHRDAHMEKFWLIVAVTFEESKILPVRPHTLVVTDLPIPVFSLMIFGLNTAS